MKHFLSDFPCKEELLNHFDPAYWAIPPKVNNHIHSPHSFSAFDTVTEAVELAAFEKIRILGINDFNVTDGFGEFISTCMTKGVFPLLNIELVGISAREKEAGIRINDPHSPGRCYVSGKGLAFPSVMPREEEDKLKHIVEGSNRQIEDVILLLNRWLEKQETGLSLSASRVKSDQALSLLRERHVARALRLLLHEKTSNEMAFHALLGKVYGGKTSEKNYMDKAGLEDEIRSRLLKQGGPAYVTEDEKVFLPLDEISSLIKSAGGIPTYPVLLDGSGDGITEFETGKELLAKKLKALDFSSVEFIPLRNRRSLLKEYVEFFYAQGFIVSFGTEHNTSAAIPLTVSCLGEEPLDDSLKKISFRGVAVIAAHQFLQHKEGASPGELDRSEMETLGMAVLYHYFEHYLPENDSQNGKE